MAGRFASCPQPCPVDRRYLILFGDWQRAVKCTPSSAGHVFGAKDGATVGLELFDARFKLLRPAVVVKTDDVGLCKLNPGGLALAARV